MNIDLYTEKFNLDEFKEKVQNILYPYGINIENYIKDHSLDPIKVDNFLEKFDINDRKAMNYILNNIKHISWKEFKTKLLSLAGMIRDKIKDENYGFIIGEGTQEHSESYFTSMVYENIFKGKNEPVFCGLDNTSTNLIYVDDCTYSGGQLSRFIKNVVNNINYVFSDTNKTFPILLEQDIKKDIIFNNSNYIITLTKNKFIFYSKDVRKEFKKENINNLLIYLAEYKKKYPESIFITSFDNPIRIFYLDINKVLYSLKKINIYLCVPYMSLNGLLRIEKEINQYTNINLEYLIEPFTYNIEAMINVAPIDIKNKVKNIFYIYYNRIKDKIQLIFPFYFDHKLASILSTLSIILGCGWVISTNLDKIKRMPITYVGPIIKNCNSLSEKTKINIEKFIYNIAINPAIVDINACSFCPKPVYSLNKEEIFSL